MARASSSRQLALGADRIDDRLAAILQLAQIDQAFGQLAQLGIVQAARRFLAVARHEGHGGAFVEQGDGGRHLLRLGADFIGDGFEDLC